MRRMRVILQSYFVLIKPILFLIKKFCPTYAN